AETLFPVLRLLVEGESGGRAIRALRRAIDEVERVLSAPFTVWIEGVLLPGASPAQRARAVDPQERFLETFARALTASRSPSPTAQRFARFAWQALLAPHREARAHARSGLVPPPSLAADLDWTEAQLLLPARRPFRASPPSRPPGMARRAPIGAPSRPRPPPPARPAPTPAPASSPPPPSPPTRTGPRPSSSSSRAASSAPSHRTALRAWRDGHRSVRHAVSGRHFAPRVRQFFLDPFVQIGRMAPRRPAAR